MADEKQIKYDVDGYDAVTTALLELINQYPGLSEGDEISFSTLDEDYGKAMFPVSGAMVESEKNFITGRAEKVCLYPFFVVYRAAGLSEARKAAVKEWLDSLGKWLEKRAVLLSGEVYTLAAYPPLTDGREILSIARQSPAYLSEEYENKTEDWVISLSARYRYEYEE